MPGRRGPPLLQQRAAGEGEHGAEGQGQGGEADPGPQVPGRGQRDPGRAEQQPREVAGAEPAAAQPDRRGQHERRLQGGDQRGGAGRDAGGRRPEDPRHVEALAEQPEHRLAQPLAPVEAADRAHQPGQQDDGGDQEPPRQHRGRWG